MHNAFVKSYNSIFQETCLNEARFSSLTDARSEI
ncbi:hypothetical protein [Roseobacter sp. OBYS 0001]